MRRKYDINLFVKKQKSFGEALLEWLLSYFKYVVVLTQVFIVLIFLYRLKVDIEIDDLQDRFSQAKAIVTSASDIVKEYERDVELISEANSRIERQKYLLNMISYFLEVYPADFFLEKLSISEGKVVMSGFSLNYRTILRFYNKIKKDKLFEDVELGSITKDGGVFKFEITLGKFSKEQK